MAAHVKISHFVRTAREDRSIVAIMEEFPGSCRSRHEPVQQSGQHPAYAWAYHINPEGAPVVLNPGWAEAACRVETRA